MSNLEEGAVSRMVKRAFAVSLLLTVFLGGTAFAAKTYETSISLHASRTSIHQGERVVFNGRLTSEAGKCFKHVTVTLYSSGQAVDTQSTSSSGRFSFEQHPSATRSWKVKFAGSTGGTHPHQFVCKASKSNLIRVHVSG